MTPLPANADKAQTAAERDRNWSAVVAHFNEIVDEAVENAVLRQAGFNPDYLGGRKPHFPIQHSRNLGEL